MTRLLVAWIVAVMFACASRAPKASDGSSADSPSAQPGRIACGSTSCDVATQDCCIAGDWTLSCGAKGSCTGAGGALSCTSPATCGSGSTCCASQDASGRTTSTCTSNPCGGYTLCASDADCPGKPCDFQVLPNGPKACDLCAQVTCGGAAQACCARTGQCYVAGCGACCQ